MSKQLIELAELLMLYCVASVAGILGVYFWCFVGRLGFVVLERSGLLSGERGHREDSGR